MPDRATVALLGRRQDCGTQHALFISTHFHGSELPQRIAQGLYDGQNRWGMPSLLTRFVVSSVMGYDEREADGFALGLEMPHTSIGTEAGRPLIVVDMVEQRVGFREWNGLAVGEWWSYDGFIGEGRWPG